jgi:hypothetical protein
LIIVTSLLCVLAGAAIFAYVRRAVIMRLKRVQEYMRAGRRASDRNVHYGSRRDR